MALTFNSKLGLWLMPAGGYCQCGEIAKVTVAEEHGDSNIMSVCTLECWGKFWDAKVAPKGGTLNPRNMNLPMMEWWEVESRFGTSYVYPGLHLVNGDVLQYRNEELELVGILVHSPSRSQDGRIFPGRIAVWVKPEAQGQGIGSKLGCAAARRWGIDLGIQKWSKMGIQMTKRAFHGLDSAPAYRSERGSN